MNREERDASAWQKSRRLISTAILLVIAIVLIGVGWRLYDARSTSQINKMLSRSPDLVKAAIDSASQDKGIIGEEWLSTLILVGRLEEAHEAGKKVVTAGGKFRQAVVFIKALAKSGRRDEAIEEAQKIENSTDRFWALVSAIEAMAKAGKNEVKPLADKALEAAGKIENGVSRSTTLVDGAEALAKAHRTGEALEVAQRIEDLGYRQRALIKIVEELIKADRTDEALEVARKIDVAGYRFQALRNVIEALFRRGKLDQAKQIENEAREAAMKEGISYTITFGGVAASAKSGRSGEQIEETRGTGNGRSRTEPVISVIKALAQAGKTNEALDTARKIDNAELRSRALTSVVEALAKGTVDQAKNVTDEALRAAKQVARDEGKSEALAIVAKALAKLHLYREARETADLCSSLSNTLDAYTTILREYHIRQNPSLAKLFEER